MKCRIRVVAVIAAAVVAIVVFAGCSDGSGGSSGSHGQAYRQVSAEEAKALMEEQGDYVILDVRTKSEYDEGHIPGAVLLPHDQVKDEAEKMLPAKDQLILVYCRSGNRSKQASQALADLGYANVVEFGGINSWPYDIER